MAKRNYINEILSIKSRIHKSKRWDIVLFHMRMMSKCVEIIDIVNCEAEDYLKENYNIFDVSNISYVNQFFPIKCVTCIEGYFRLVIANLIDLGNPFRENAKRFSDVNFSIETVLSLQIEDVSVGDFIAHMLPIKSFEQICSIMSILIGADFKNEIKTIYLTLPVFKPLFGTIEDFFNEIIKQVVEMFNYRHIYCHELGIPDKVRYTSSGCVESTIKFLHLTEIFVEQITSKK